MAKTTWRVTYNKCVAKQIGKLNPDVRDAVFETVQALQRSENPCKCQGVKELYIDYPGCHRIPVKRKWRVIFQLLTGEEVTVKLQEGQKGVLHLQQVILRGQGYKRK